MAINEVGKSTIIIDNKQAEDALKGLTAEVDKYTQKLHEARKAQDPAAIKKYTKELNAARKTQKEYAKTVVDVTKVLNNLNGTSYNNLMKTQRQLQKETRSMNKNTKEEIALYKLKVAQLNKVTAHTSKLRKEMSGFNGVSKRMSFGLRNIGAALGISGGIYMVVNAIKDFINVSMELEKSLSSLSAITGLYGDDLDYMKEKSIEFSSQTLKSANEIVKAFELVGSIRPELLQDKEALAEVTKQAIILSEATGGKLGLEEAARATAGTLNQFSKASTEAAETINVLAAGSKFGAAAVVDITTAIDKFGAVADQANISLETSVGLIETLAEKQIVGAEAGTKLRNILIILQGDQENYKDGIFDINLALDNLGKANKDVTELTQQFGKENVVAAQILVTGRQKVIDYTEAVTGTNTALEQQQIQNNNLAGAVTKLSNTWDTFLIKINTSNGWLAENVRFITALVNKFDDLDAVFSKKGIINGMLTFKETLEEINKIKAKEAAELFDSNGIVKETALATKSIEELDEELKQLNRDSKIYYDNWQKSSGEQRAFWSVEYDKSKQNIELINEQIEANKVLNTVKKQGNEALTDVVTLDEYIKANKESFENWKQARDEYLRDQAIYEAETKKAYEEAIAEEFAMEEEESVTDITDDPAFIKTMNLAQAELDIYKNSYQGRLDALDEMHAQGLITEKEYQQELYNLNQETVNKKLQKYHAYLGAAAMALEAWQMFQEVQMNKELKLAGDNQEEQDRIRIKYAKKEQFAASAQAQINGAMAIMNLWGNNMIPYPAAVPFNAIMTGIIAAITMAQVGIINSKQFATGNYLDVMGADDGRTYHAQMGNNQSRLVTQPTYEPGLGLVGEQAPELVFSGADTQAIMNTPALINAINDTIGVRQFANGNAREIITNNTNTTEKTFTDPVMIEMMGAILSYMKTPPTAVLLANEDYIRTHNEETNKYDTFQQEVN